MPKKSDAPEAYEIFKLAQQAVLDVQAKEAARDDAAQTLAEKRAELESAQEILASYRDQLNDLLGPLVKSADSRVRMG